MKRIKDLKKDQLLIILLFGILLFVIAIPASPKKEVQEQKTQEGEAEEDRRTALPAESYEAQQEQRLKAALGKVEGVGRVEVMITLKASSEKIVEKDAPADSQLVEETDAEGGTRRTRENSQSEETVYREEEDGRKTPYVIKELEPQVEGVIVIAQGGGKSEVKQNILEAVQALFPVEAHKIKIMKMEDSK